MTSSIHTLEDVTQAFATIASKITEEYGERCASYDWGCAICIAWEVYDKLQKILSPEELRPPSTGGEGI